MYDIIGDIHGHADKLEQLLVRLGYKSIKGVYEHSSRQCIFLGDFIDRGPEIRASLKIVKSMCDSGNAMAIMGNHEFNAIGFHTVNPQGGFFRNHHFSEINQHYKTLEEFKDNHSEWYSYLDWFHQLPLFMEFDSFRVVHACWDANHIEWIKNNDQLLYQNNKTVNPGLSDHLLRDYYQKENPIYSTIDEVLKGKEFKLPDNQSFLDSDGHRRDKARIKWWVPKEERTINHDIFLGIDDQFGNRCLSPGDLDNIYHYNDSKVVFFGHYWLKGEPQITNTNAICLDFSVAKNGFLTAYRWDGGEINEKNLVYV
jgi:hypothetical protein